ncbi:MAG: hypothetical protein J5630_07170 [Bacteroidaceae bacterium]|nr:hypothetical protein [Bacteroidaceae bacterium]
MTTTVNNNNYFISKARDAYVLTRVYNDYSSGSKFKDRFQKAAESVNKNARNYKRGNVIWMLYDDSPDKRDYKNHKEELLDICLSYGFSKEEGNLIYSHSNKPGNSSYASYCIREKFLKHTEEDDTALAVLLDQDDILEPDAIKNIALKMTDNGVVLLPFTIIDYGGKDITFNSGKVHNELTKKISKCPIVNKSAPVIKQHHWNNLKEIFYASSLSWSKSYSRYALEQYHNSLTDFLKKERIGVQEYYEKHPAYEDFVDFYVLLRSDITVSATSYRTHKYYKHNEAITCNPDLDAFRLHRTANLLTLIDLCYYEAEILRPDYKQLLLRFITIKVVDIERILDKYRENYTNGDNSYYVFSDETHEGYFIDKLYRLSQGENRGSEQDEQLFKDAHPIRNEKTKENFNDLFWYDNINNIEVYHSELKNVSSRCTLRKAFLEENQFRTEKAWFQQFYTFTASEFAHIKKIIIKQCNIWFEKLVWKHKEEKKNINYDNKPTPNQRRFRVLSFLLILWGIIIPATTTFFVLILWGKILPLIKEDKFQTASLVVTAFVSVWVAILTSLWNDHSKAHILAKEETAKKKLYFSEFEDLIRHLEANLKVMIEIHYQLLYGKIPAGIHFINLSWPNFSCLLSDDITKLIDKNKVDDFARLKVNLRNIQNSSTWLSVYVQEPHSHEEIKKAIEWEITRHIGYLVNFRYLKEYNFQSPTQNDIEFYIGEKHIKQSLTSLFMSYHGEGERMKKVEEYLNSYFNDRMEKRSVLLYKIHTP